MMSRVPILKLEQISKSFGAVNAVDSVNLEIFGHDVVALVGDNAAGKSTIARMVAGVYPPTAGQIYMNGLPVDIGSTRAAFDLGIATVFQELALCENLDVTSNVFLGRELHDQSGLLAEKQMEVLATSYIERLGGRIPDVRVPLSSLSGGQRQCVAIARTLVSSPQLVVLDEPTAALSVSQTADVLTYIEGLREMGLGVIFISHNLTDVRAVADRIVVLRHGRVNGLFDARGASYEEVIASMTGATTLEKP